MPCENGDGGLVRHHVIKQGLAARIQNEAVKETQTKQEKDKAPNSRATKQANIEISETHTNSRQTTQTNKRTDKQTNKV